MVSSFASGSCFPADVVPVNASIMWVVTIDGQIVRKMFGTGTKSEHEAICLVTTKGDYLLRRSAANPFEPDRELDSLVGKQVRISGTLSGYTFFVSGWQENDR